MPLDLKSLIKKLSAAAGPSGFEGPVRDVLREEWAGRADELRTDSLGNLIAVKRGAGPEPRRRVMIAAHMDEIGLLVSEVREGFLRTGHLGGIDHRVLLGQTVLVHGRRVLPGVFGAAPPHMSRSREKYPKLDELWVDVGLPADEVAQVVRVGDLVTFDAAPCDLKGQRVAGKSLDNRVSLAAVTLCLDELGRRAHDWDVIAVASVQEEIGSIGAVTAAYALEPDLCIAIDTTFGAQPGIGSDESFALGSGPTLAIGPNFHPRLLEKTQALAGELEIKTQVEPLPGDSGTDAWVIQVSREGVPCVLVSIPIRNMHTPSEVVDLRDVRRAGQLMAALIASLAPGFLDEIAWPLPDQAESPAARTAPVAGGGSGSEDDDDSEDGDE